MPDISAPWSGDLDLSLSGGLALVIGSAEARQRLIRRLLTCPGDDAFDPGYGAGLPLLIGRPISVPALTALVREQATLEPTVVSVTSVTVTSDGLGGVTVGIAYVDLSGPQTLDLPISN